ncbi:MAG TPA: hypothetical protein VFY64_11475 [Nitrososphaeraceae archaeon]|nr:hypothetical protein [Nitrososphaeraceae archaeon]
MIIGFGLVSKFNEIFLSPILANGGGAPWCWPETSKARCPVIRAVKENTPRNNIHSIFVIILSKGQIILTTNYTDGVFLISTFVYRSIDNSKNRWMLAIHIAPDMIEAMKMVKTPTK